MSKTIRIASFNVENLFRRARIINLTDSDRIRDLLNKYADLNAIIAKKTYTDANKKQILKHLRDLKHYAKANVDMGRFVNKKLTKVNANGRGDWAGGVDLVKQKFNAATRGNTARVIKEANADILCVIEAENRPTLHRFSKDLLKQTGKFKKYPFNILIDGNDTRGIDVGLYSRYPIRSIRTNIFDDDGSRSVFSRDCLEVEIDVGLHETLWVLINHLKSKGYGKPKDNDARRKAQATRVKEILKERHNVENGYVVVAGDMNDLPGSAPLRPMVKQSGLHDVLEWKFKGDMKERWTYEYRGGLNQIDYILVSSPLKHALVDAGVLRRGIYDIDKITNGAVKRYDTIKRPTEAASDHGLVFADLKLP